MGNLDDLLQKRKLEIAAKAHEGFKRDINTKWEVADEFGKYVGLPTTFVLRLFRIYGQNKVLSIRSWLKDCPYDPAKGGKIALAVWKLKQDKLA